MKSYIVVLGLQIGEYEKQSQVLVIADTFQQAERCALLSETHCTNTMKWSKDLLSVKDDCGGMVYKIVSVSELTDMEYNTIKRYLTTMTYDLDELMRSGNYAEIVS